MKKAASALIRRESWLATTIRRLRPYRRGAWDRMLAEVEQNNTKLTPSIRKKCLEYSREVFGEAKYTPLLGIYASVQGRWIDGWMPETYAHRQFVRKLLPVPCDISKAKTLSNFFLSSEHLPDLAYRYEGGFYDRAWQPLERKDLDRLLFEDRDRVVFKSDGPGCGLGVTVLTRADWDAAPADGLGNGCFQSYVEPHREVGAFGVAAVPTIRLITIALPGGTISPRAAYLRLGRAGQSHIVSDDSIRVPLDLSSGALYETGMTTGWRRVMKHPDTGIAFAGKEIPMMAEVIEMSMSLHRKVPFVPSIGWDVCIDAGGTPRLIEWNILHGIKTVEAANGPHFADLGWETLWRRPSAPA